VFADRRSSSWIISTADSKEAILNQPGKLPCLEAKNLGRVNTTKSIPAPRFSISQITTYRSAWEDDLRGLEASSFGALGLWLPKLAEVDSNVVIKRLREAEIAVSSVSFVGGFTGSNGASFTDALDHAYETLFFASSIGARCVVVTPGSRGRYTEKHERKLVTQVIRELACMGQELGVDVGILPMRAELARRWTFLHSLDDARSLLADVGHQRAGLVLDSFQHLNSMTDLAELGQLASEIKHVQLSDVSLGARTEYARSLPGDGDLPLSELMSSLLSNGYRGYFDIQVWSRDVWSQTHEAIIQQCDDWARAAQLTPVLQGEPATVTL